MGGGGRSGMIGAQRSLELQRRGGGIGELLLRMMLLLLLVLLLGKGLLILLHLCRKGKGVGNYMPMLHKA